MSVGKLVEELAIANIKLFKVCDDKAKIAANPDKFTKKEMVEVMRKDIELCKQRAKLKTAIDQEVARAIMSGEHSVTDEVKSYG